ncbi:precorrin-3B synthase [Rhizobium sp. PP-CC-3G-465]|uniref:precorrin-3B synthase n=1 Tax=Rhizobium sp. PP-CC-3G-465 TaxID=2135648 RepID=UPI001044359B|nr:precorrin-3B synthase [Rhizobium sp. PP-CC-3G-465]
MMMAGTAMRRDRTTTGSPSALRRGACPTLAAPMQTGDGLLARLRPASGFFTAEAFLALLDAADAFGSGRLDITARGNLQIRGLRAESVAPLSAAIAGAGIMPCEGIAVEMPPLAGLDPSEGTDPRPLARKLADRIGDSGLHLAPKLAIIVDGGGRLHLDGVAADIKLVAEAAGASSRWRLLVAGRQTGLVGTADEMIEAAMSVVEHIAACGPAARARDLPADRLPSSSSSLVKRDIAMSPVGRFDLGAHVVLGVAPAFGQMEAQAVRQLVLAAMAGGLSEVRLAPGRALLLVGPAGCEMSALALLAKALGFVVDAGDPALRIDACAGQRGCASARIDTHAVAGHLIARAPALMDGSLDLHVSGCAKGCARPRAADLTLVAAFCDGQPGLGIVVGGRAGDSPVATKRLEDGACAITALGQWVAETIEKGESAAACLKRLGPARIAAAFSGARFNGIDHAGL